MSQLDPSKAWLGNVPRGIDKGHVKRLLGQHGVADILDVGVFDPTPAAMEAARSRGGQLPDAYAFVHFPSEVARDRGIVRMNGLVCLGPKPLRCEAATLSTGAWLD